MKRAPIIALLGLFPDSILRAIFTAVNDSASQSNFVERVRSNADKAEIAPVLSTIFPATLDEDSEIEVERFNRIIQGFSVFLMSMLKGRKDKTSLIDVLANVLSFPRAVLEKAVDAIAPNFSTPNAGVIRQVLDKILPDSLKSKAEEIFTKVEANVATGIHTYEYLYVLGYSFSELMKTAKGLFAGVTKALNDTGFNVRGELTDAASKASFEELDDTGDCNMNKHGDFNGSGDVDNSLALTVMGEIIRHDNLEPQVVKLAGDILFAADPVENSEFLQTGGLKFKNFMNKVIAIGGKIVKAMPVALNIATKVLGATNPALGMVLKGISGVKNLIDKGKGIIQAGKDMVSGVVGNASKFVDGITGGLLDDKNIPNPGEQFEDKLQDLSNEKVNGFTNLNFGKGMFSNLFQKIDNLAINKDDGKSSPLIPFSRMPTGYDTPQGFVMPITSVPDEDGTTVMNSRHKFDF